mgnify:CR=1 FL=1
MDEEDQRQFRACGGVNRRKRNYELEIINYKFQFVILVWSALELQYSHGQTDQSDILKFIPYTLSFISLLFIPFYLIIYTSVTKSRNQNVLLPGLRAIPSCSATSATCSATVTATRLSKAPGMI